MLQMSLQHNACESGNQDHSQDQNCSIMRAKAGIRTTVRTKTAA